jgi:hypothetical protein
MKTQYHACRAQGLKQERSKSLCFFFHDHDADANVLNVMRSCFGRRRG